MTTRVVGERHAATVGRRAAAWLGAAMLVSAGAQAADPAPPARDPTLPPASMQAPNRSAEPAAAAAVAVPTPRHVMTVDGRRYLIEGGRRHAVGDLLGTARIERIDDGSVWLNEGGTLRQVSLYGGIVKRKAPESEPAPRAGNTAAAATPTPTPTPTPPRRATAAHSAELSMASPNPPNR